jgi:hypothetical protein
MKFLNEASYIFLACSKIVNFFLELFYLSCLTLVEAQLFGQCLLAPLNLLLLFHDLILLSLVLLPTSRELYLYVSERLLQLFYFSLSNPHRLPCLIILSLSWSHQVSAFISLGDPREEPAGVHLVVVFHYSSYI